MRELFEFIVERCIKEGLIGGEGFAVDASLIKADVTKQRSADASETVVWDDLPTSINPKGKVPTLVRDDGSVLTEYVAIATWLARALEAMNYVVGTLHMQGFARAFKPANFEPADVVHRGDPETPC